MIKTVLILGNHIQALGLARQVYLAGLKVVLLTDNKYSITRYSKAIEQTLIFKDEKELTNNISIYADSAKHTLLFPTNDSMVNYLSNNYALLSGQFYLGIPDPKVVKIFGDKRNTFLFAKKYGIPIPESYIPETLQELKEISGQLSYPVVLKPAVMYKFHKVFGKKAFKCDSKDELIKKAAEVALKIPVNQLIIQEFLNGGAKTLYSYGTFAANGKAIASVMVNRTRQNPMLFGNSTTYALTCNIPEVKQKAEKILQLTNYFGLAEVEFMYDNRTKEYKFLEINTRAWKWHSISNGLGFSFIEKMISYLNNNDTTEIKDFDTTTGWIERLTDTFVVLKELLKGNNLLTEFIKSYRKKNAYAVWDPSDIKPFIMYILLSPILFFTRH